jgi:hypothetical protein
MKYENGEYIEVTQDEEAETNFEFKNDIEEEND